MSEIVNDEMSFRELVQQIKEFVFEIFRKWYFVVLITIPFLIYFLYTHYTTKTSFSAKTKFVVEGGNTVGSGLGGLLGQIGLRGGGGGKYNNFKILEVGNSNNIFIRTLFEKYKNDFIANHLIELYELDKLMAKDKPEFLNFKFKNSDHKSFNPLELKMLAALVNMVSGGEKKKNPILSMSYDEDMGIFSLYSSSRNDELTIKLLNTHYNNLKHFFEDELLEAQIKTTAIIKAKADSIETLIKVKTAKIGYIQDRTMGLVLATPNIEKEALIKEVAALAGAQSEFLKSYEMADIGLRDIRAAFVKIDETIPPLSPVDSSLLMSIIKALTLGGLAASVIISLNKLYRESV